MSRSEETDEDEQTTSQPTLPQSEEVTRTAGARGARQNSSRPRRVGRYRITGSIGEGGMGVVLRGHDDDLDRAVAIKLLHTSKRQQLAAHARMQREARAMARLAHPNVVMVHEIGVHDGQVFIAMEHVAGRTLRKWMNDEHSQAEILAMFIGAGRGLAAAHRADIIHRDFKPDNVLVGDDGRARVVDFGLAATLADGSTSDDDDPPGERERSLDLLELTRTGAILGTPAYMAPEQFDGAATDARTDQFAFCVALHEALYRTRPFPGKTMFELARAVKKGHIARPRGTKGRVDQVSQRLRRVVVKGLACDPADRFTSMDALLGELEVVAAGQRAGRYPRWLAAVGIMVLAAIAAGALYVSRGQKNDPALAQPAKEDPAPSVVRLRAEEVTRAPVDGSLSFAADPPGRRLLYRENGRFFVRELAGGAPAPVTIAGVSPPIVALDTRGEGLIAVQDRVLYEIDVSGNASAIATLEAIPTAVFPSPDGRSLAIFVRDVVEIWDLGQKLAPRRRFKLDAAPEAYDWSPDSSQLVMSRWSVSATESTRLLVEILDLERGVIVSMPVEGMDSGIAWVAPRAAIMAERGGWESRLRCLHISDESIAMGEVATVELSAGLISVEDHAGKNAVLLKQDTGHMIAGILELDGPRRLSPISPGFGPDELQPVWLSSDAIAFLSTRFVTHFALLTAERRDLSRVEVLLDKDARWLASDGQGGIVVDRYSPEGSSLEHATAAKLSLRPVFSPPRGLEDDQGLRCATPRQCVILDGSRITALDLATGATHELLTCPAGYGCGRYARWSLSPDGREVLLAQKDQAGIAVFDLRSGEKRWSSPPLPAADAIVQSGTWLGDGRSFVATGMQGPGHDEPYTVWRIGPDGQYEVLWSSSNMWVVSPQVSPDGTAIALSGQFMQAQAWRVELDGFCQATEP